jgi:hypothetical protein
MIRAGGLFILIMGCGVLLGALLPVYRKVFLGIAVAVASLAMVFLGPGLSASLGPPTRLQLMALIGAILIEGPLIRVAVARYRAAGERPLLLAILFVVGIHFLPMGIAFGPLCMGLGVALCFNAGTGLWLAPSLPLNALWSVDGLLKMAFGAAMIGIK